MTLKELKKLGSFFVSTTPSFQQILGVNVNQFTSSSTFEIPRRCVVKVACKVSPTVRSEFDSHQRLRQSWTDPLTLGEASAGRAKHDRSELVIELGRD